MDGVFAPQWPSLLAASVAVLLSGAAFATGLVDREGTVLTRWRLWVFSGLSGVVSLILFALEGLRFPGVTP